MSQCKSCGEAAVVVDASTDNFPVCMSCGVIQSFNLYSDDPTFDRNGRACSSYVLPDFSYRERKLFQANNTISELTDLLGLSSARAALVSRMVNDVTDSELGGGAWFEVLIAACSHIVTRQHGLPLSITEAADIIGRDAREVGRMVSRVSRHLGMDQLPEFDICESLARSLRSCRCLDGLEEAKAEQMGRQGNFLLRCCVKWSLSTGRHPLPLVAAVISFVAEVNGVSVSLEDIAKEMFAVVSTARLRRKEIERTLVRAARVLLPWGEDVNVKNIVHNAQLLLRFMEIKSKAGAFDLGTFCVREQDGGYDYESTEAAYFGSRNADGGIGTGSDEIQWTDKLSAECLSSACKKALESCSQMEVLDESATKNKTRKRKSRGLVIDAQMSASSKEKMPLEKILEIDLGYDTLPPSFVSGLEAREKRRRKMKVARARISEIMRPLKKVSVLEEDPITLAEERPAKKIDGKTDWEDCIIELLLLHGVKEEDIEEGHYKRLLDLHVFNSVDARKVRSLKSSLQNAYRSMGGKGQ